MNNINSYPLHLRHLLSGSALLVGGYFFNRVLDQNYHPEHNDFKCLNNSEVTFTASLLKVRATILHLSTLDRDIKLKGKSNDTPNGWGYLVIGS